jgi:hypothetical protein
VINTASLSRDQQAPGSRPFGIDSDISSFGIDSDISSFGIDSDISSFGIDSDISSSGIGVAGDPPPSPATDYVRLQYQLLMEGMLQG